MPDLWIDHHTGDEAIPRPEFKADLRASLAKDLGRRHAPWGTIAWAAAAVAAVVVIAVAVVATRDDHDTISPAPTGIDVAAITDRTWYVVSDNGTPVPGVSDPATFTLRADGSFTGSDGCNLYGSSIDASQPKSGWAIEGTSLHIFGTGESTAVGCVFATAMPLVDGSALALSDDGTTLTLTSDRAYVATTLPPLTGQALADRLVGVKWYVTSVDDELTPRVAWFTLSKDGSVQGFNGCNDYGDGTWSLAATDEGNELTVSPVVLQQANRCLLGASDIIPLTGNTSRISVDGTGRGLIIANEQVYTAVADDATADPSATTTTIATTTT